MFRVYVVGSSTKICVLETFRVIRDMMKVIIYDWDEYWNEIHLVCIFCKFHHLSAIECRYYFGEKKTWLCACNIVIER